MQYAQHKTKYMDGRYVGRPEHRRKLLRITFSIQVECRSVQTPWLHTLTVTSFFVSNIDDEVFSAGIRVEKMSVDNRV
jgi:hypothetical protein